MTSAIAADQVVTIHYTLRDDKNEVLDSSDGQDPLLYLHGHWQIVPGLENALAGRKVGEKVSVSVPASEGYGEYDARLTSEVQRSQFPKGAPLEVDALFEFSNSQGHPVVVRVTEVGETTVKVDANHPLAGKQLNFDVEVVAIRPATKEELEHGHAHGAGGHDH